MGVGDVGIEGSDINSRHEGVGGKGHDERPNNLEEKFVFYVGGEGFEDGLELCIDLHLNLPNVLDVNVKKIQKTYCFISDRSQSLQQKRFLKSLVEPRYKFNKMYRLFKEKYPDIHANLTLYRKIFKRDFNLHFGTIRSETCKESDKNWALLIEARDEEEQKKIEPESSVHNIMADEAYKTLSVNSANAIYITLCIYLQQVLFALKLTHSDVYYQW
jgi:hypothetical protein